MDSGGTGGANLQDMLGLSNLLLRLSSFAERYVC